MLLTETKASLVRLGIECIDIYYLHRMYPESVVTIEDVAGDMKKLVDLGLIRGYGFSEASAS